MDQQSAAVMNLATEKASEMAARPKENAVPALTAKTSDAPDHNEIFLKLVTGDEDIIGLVAYSLYKQNKIDWMRAFEERSGRAPNDQEFAAYIIGENTPRRVSTYRFLAESTVNRSNAAQGGSAGAGRPILSATINIFYGLLGVGVVAAAIVLLRFIFSLRH